MSCVFNSIAKIKYRTEKYTKRLGGVFSRDKNFVKR